MTNETDRELLELAAKAAGVSTVWRRAFRSGACSFRLFTHPRTLVHGRTEWNPLEDDGDSLRLAVNLKLDIHFFNGYAEVHAGGDGIKSASVELYGDDMAALTRRAIVRAAAEIGKSIP